MKAEERKEQVKCVMEPQKLDGIVCQGMFATKPNLLYRLF